jgi:hypothetical protein
MTALSESAFGPGATVYRPLPVRLKLLTTGLASAGYLTLCVSCAVAFGSNCSLVTLQKNMLSFAFEVTDGVPSAPTHMRFSLY